MSMSRRHFLAATGLALSGRARAALGAVAPRGLALLVGISRVRPQTYDGWNEPLPGCEQDIQKVGAIARRAGFEVSTLRDAEATRAAVLAALRDAAGATRPGDLFLFYYSGHGTQVPDRNGDEHLDGQDEAFCLHDGLLIDDEIRAIWTQFPAGARVLALVDSCHSATAAAQMAPPPPGAGAALPRSRPWWGTAAALLGVLQVDPAAGPPFGSDSAAAPDEMPRPELLPSTPPPGIAAPPIAPMPAPHPAAPMQIPPPGFAAPPAPAPPGDAGPFPQPPAKALPEMPDPRLGPLGAEEPPAPGGPPDDAERVDPQLVRARYMPRFQARTPGGPGGPLEIVDITRRILERDRALYDPALEAARRAFDRPIRASLLVLAACQDYQQALGSPFGGFFTVALERIWANGTFVGDYTQFHEAIQRRLEREAQTPTLAHYGPPAPEFEAQRPFTI